MLYKVLKWLLYLTTKAYFRSIYVQGRELIPKKGPVIFAANHASAFMDPILLGVYIKRPLYFLARGDVFKNKIVNYIFAKLHMIPVYKPDLSPGQLHKNEMVFKKCYEHLGKQNTLTIFPEGTSRTERRLRPIKTGISRIALGAEHQKNFELNLTIVPIGLNYSNPHYFKSDVFVNFGPPIKVSDYQSAYNNDEKEAVVQLTERVKIELEKRIVIIEDERLDRIIKQIEILYRSKLRDESKPGQKAPQDFYLSKDIVKAVEYFAKHKPKKLENFEKKIGIYLSNLKRLNIRDTQVRTSRVSLNLLWKLTYFALGFPLFLYGLITNFIPFKLAEFISNKIPAREDFVGSVKLGVGMMIFLILYIIEAVVFGTYTNLTMGLLFLITLYPAGLFTINYFKTYYQLRGTVKYIRLFMRKSNLIAQLKTTRQELVAELEESKKEFINLQ